MVDHSIHQRNDGIAFSVFEIICCPAVSAAGKENREVDLFICCIEIHKELKHFVHNLVYTGIGTVDFIDNNDDFEPESQCFIQHEPCLGQRTFCSINKKQCAVSKVQNAFDLSAEVTVPRGVDHVDLGIPVVQTDILCKNCDPAFPFQIVAVHKAGIHFLIFTEQFGLLDQLVDQRRLSVVNVCDNRYISDVLISHNPVMEPFC